MKDIEVFYNYDIDNLIAIKDNKKYTFEISFTKDILEELINTNNPYNIRCGYDTSISLKDDIFIFKNKIDEFLPIPKDIMIIALKEILIKIIAD